MRSQPPNPLSIRLPTGSTPGKYFFAERLVDHGHELAARLVGLGEAAPLAQGDAERLEVVTGDDAEGRGGVGEVRPRPRR